MTAGTNTCAKQRDRRKAGATRRAACASLRFRARPCPRQPGPHCLRYNDRATPGLEADPYRKAASEPCPSDTAPEASPKARHGKALVHGCARTPRNVLATQKFRGDMCVYKPCIAQFRSEIITP